MGRNLLFFVLASVSYFATAQGYKPFMEKADAAAKENDFVEAIAQGKKALEFSKLRMVVQSGSMRAFKRTLRSIPHSGQRVRSVLPLRVALRRARFGSHPLSIASVRAPGSVTTASTTIGTSPRTRVTPSETKKRPGGQSGGLADPTRGAARGTPNASNNAHAAGRRGANQYRRRAYTFVVRATSRRSG
jgi:hypothetical protein